MGYTLNGTTIARPVEMHEDNSTQVAQNRSLNGVVSRDYFGSNKRVWTLDYRTKVKGDYDTINAIYQAYLAAGNAIPFISTETNYSIPSTNVHMDLLSRGFTYHGNQYLSDFTLILTEA